MKLSWGYRIGLVYIGFVILIVVMVFAALHQHFDLVSNDYYGEEIAYQKVIDAGKNQAALTTPILLNSDASTVHIIFPALFNNKTLQGTVQFYSPVDSKNDKELAIKATNNVMDINRADWAKTAYVAKINLVCEGKKYYQETPINLSN
jgi:hypothetical protein